MSKRALGKGISALLPGEEGVSLSGAEMSIQQVPLEKLTPSPDQPRKTFEPSALKELADSIRTQGVIQPLVVERRGENYVIIVGERRFRAAQIAGLSEIPVICKELSDEDRLEMALIENIQREDLNPIEEAEAYQNLMVKTGLNQEQVAGKVGKQRSTVANSLRLLKLSDEMKAAVVSGTMSPGHARAVLSLVNPSDQTILFQKIVTKGISVREAEQEAADLNAGKKVKAPKTRGKPSRKTAEIQAIEEQLIGYLGTKVAVQGTLDKGKIAIEYFSRDDLERVYDLLLSKSV